MGNSESTPNQLAQSKHGIINQIDEIMQNLTLSSARCRSVEDKVIFIEHRKRIEKLTTAFDNFCRIVESNKAPSSSSSPLNVQNSNSRILRTDVPNSGRIEELERNLAAETKTKENLKNRYENSIQAFKKKQIENENKMLLESNLRKMAEQKTTSLLNEITILKRAKQKISEEFDSIYQSYCELNKELEMQRVDHEKAMLSYKLETERCDEESNKAKQELKKEIEIHEIYKVQAKGITYLEDKIKELQENLNKERKEKQDQFDKIELIKEYCDSLKKEQSIEREKYEAKITCLQNQLSGEKSNDIGKQDEMQKDNSSVANVAKYPERNLNASSSDVNSEEHRELMFVKECYKNLLKEFDIRQAERNNQESILRKEINRFKNINKSLHAQLNNIRRNHANQMKLRQKVEREVSLLQKQISDQEDEKSKTIKHLQKDLEIKKTEYEDAILKYKEELDTSKSDIQVLQEVCDNLEKHVILLEEQVTNGRKLGEKLQNCEDELEVERETRRNESEKLLSVQKQLSVKQAEIEKEVMKYNRQTQQLNRMKRDLNSALDDCRQMEMLKKRADNSAALLEKQNSTLKILQETLINYQDHVEEVKTTDKQEQSANIN